MNIRFSTALEALCATAAALLLSAPSFGQTGGSGQGTGSTGNAQSTSPTSAQPASPPGVSALTQSRGKKATAYDAEIR